MCSLRIVQAIAAERLWQLWIIAPKMTFAAAPQLLERDMAMYALAPGTTRDTWRTHRIRERSLVRQGRTEGVASRAAQVDVTETPHIHHRSLKSRDVRSLDFTPYFGCAPLTSAISSIRSTNE